MNQENIIELIGFPKAVIFDTDNTLYPYLPAHKEATRAVEDKVEKLLGIDRVIYINELLMYSHREILKHARSSCTTLSRSSGCAPPRPRHWKRSSREKSPRRSPMKICPTICIEKI